MEGSRNPDKRIPDNCHNCPVLARYAIILDMAKRRSTRDAKRTLESLDDAQTLDASGKPYRWDMQQAIAREQSAAAMASFEYIVSDEYDRLLQTADLGCDGPVRRTWNNRIMRGLMKHLSLEDACYNTGFRDVYDDADIRLQLSMGNWHDPRKTD